MVKKYENRVKLGVSKKNRIDNFRIERYKAFRNSNICSVEVSCYCDTSNFKSLGLCLTRLECVGNIERSKLKDNGLDSVFVFNDIPITTYTNGNGFCLFGCQFKLDGVTSKLDEVVYEVVEDSLINIINDSGIVILNK